MPDSPIPSLSPPIPDDPNPDTLPLPLSASLILTSLPQDATTALAKASDDVDGIPPKVTIRFQPVGSAPHLRQKIFKVSSANRFETVVSFLSKKLKGMEGVDGEGGGVFCYVNSVFAPGLDEGVGGLWRVSALFHSPSLVGEMGRE
ncbi:MAG: Ubiquitin-like protein [Alectoria fallacina]|uniref:Ubiquitin-like protein ATG12 n=1 Tax=Alectoria fallacina TaxID=1903189 RepID=A0A8H3I942_9LECA|nr:MAG: Ubiquitin-like protein [Alectoria fallacina]